MRIVSIYLSYAGFRESPWFNRACFVNERAKWTRDVHARYIEVCCKNQTGFVLFHAIHFFFANDSTGAANIVNWNHFDCVVTHTVRLYAPMERVLTITGGHRREYAWLKICTCESIIGFVILYRRGSTTVRDEKSVGPRWLCAISFPV